MRGRRHGQRDDHRARLSVFSIVVAVVIFVVVARLGLGILRMLAREPPKPPPPGELRKVDVRYRCSVCGMEMRVMLAPDQDPPPPRHCMEEMDLVRQE